MMTFFHWEKSNSTPISMDQENKLATEIGNMHRGKKKKNIHKVNAALL